MKRPSLFVVLSGFESIKGPIVIDLYPTNLDKKNQNVIASKSIDLLHDGINITKKQTFIDFTTIGRKGLTKSFKLKSNSNRFPQTLVAITILFEDKDDAIFYKYNEDFTPIFSQFVNHLSELPINNPFEYDFSNELKTFYEEINITIENLARIEHSSENIKEFPSSKEIAKEPSFYFKIIVVGDPEVGKTSTILRFTDNAFRRSYISTIGANLSIKDIEYEGNLIELVLYDLAGQQKYSAIRKQFYQKTNAIFIIFDLTNYATFESVMKWYQDLKENLDDFDEIPMILCGNKSDLQNERVVSEKNAINLAHQKNIPYFEISALTGQNNKLIFETIVSACWKNLKTKYNERS